MGVNVSWDNAEHTILHWDFIDHWDWKEFLAAQQQTIDLMNTVPHTVHVIVDVSRAPGLPAGALGQLHNYRKSESPNAGRVVIVGMNQLVKAAVTMFLRIFPADWGTVTFANSVEEARIIVVSK